MTGKGLCLCIFSPSMVVANMAGCMRAAVATATDQASHGKLRIQLSHLLGFGSEVAGTREETWYEGSR